MCQTNQITSIFLAFTFTTTSIFTTGCGEQQIENSHKLSSYYETIPVPEDGWTTEKAASVFYIDGKSIEIPFTVDSLGDMFQLKRKGTIIEEYETATSYLYYNNEPFLICDYTGVTSFKQLSEKETVGICFASGCNIETHNQVVTFNGVKIGMDKDEVQIAFGEADKTSDVTWIYLNKTTSEPVLGFGFDENEKLRLYSILMK